MRVEWWWRLSNKQLWYKQVFSCEYWDGIHLFPEVKHSWALFLGLNSSWAHGLPKYERKNLFIFPISKMLHLCIGHQEWNSNVSSYDFYFRKWNCIIIKSFVSSIFNSMNYVIKDIGQNWFTYTLKYTIFMELNDKTFIILSYLYVTEIFLHLLNT